MFIKIKRGEDARSEKSMKKVQKPSKKGVQNPKP